MEVLNNSYVAVYFDRPNALLTLKWKRQISYDERLETFLWAYEFSRANLVKNWLIDDEEIFIITSEEKAWITNTWTAMVADSGIEKIAVVTSDHIPNLLANTEFTTSAQEKYKQHSTTQHEVFTEYKLAFQWLTQDLPNG